MVPLSTPRILRRDPERSGKVKEPTSLSSLTEPLAGERRRRENPAKESSVKTRITSARPALNFSLENAGLGSADVFSFPLPLPPLKDKRCVGGSG